VLTPRELKNQVVNLQNIATARSCVSNHVITMLESPKKAIACPIMPQIPKKRGPPPLYQSRDEILMPVVGLRARAAKGL
jgi:hypothetical protein